MNNHYQTLKVSRDAPPEVIRMAYKVLCQKYHPDKYPENRVAAEQIMKALNAAYAVLSDPDKRKDYDDFLDEAEALNEDLKQSGTGQQSQKPKTEPKQEARQNPYQSQANPQNKPYDSTRQPPPKSRQQPESHHPWRRVTARYIDMNIFAFIGAFGFALLFPYPENPVMGQLLYALVAIVSCILLEPVVLMVFGGTPGKAILNISVESKTYPSIQTVPFSELLKRTFQVYFFGLGLGLFLFLAPFFFLFNDYKLMKQTGVTRWDKACDTQVNFGEMGFIRFLAGATLVISFLTLNFVGKTLNRTERREWYAAKYKPGESSQIKTTQTATPYIEKSSQPDTLDKSEATVDNDVANQEVLENTPVANKQDDSEKGNPVLNIETYTIDPDHTMPVFKVNHLGLSTQLGRFDKTSGTAVLDIKNKAGTVEWTVQANSINMGQTKWNDHLKSDDFFNVEKFPTITFKSDKMIFQDYKLVAAEGTLTLLGVTKPLRLTIHHFTCGKNPMNNRPMCAADVEANLKRSDFGMDKYVPALGDEIKVLVPVEAYKDNFKGLGLAYTKGENSPSVKNNMQSLKDVRNSMNTKERRIFDIALVLLQDFKSQEGENAFVNTIQGKTPSEVIDLARKEFENKVTIGDPKFKQYSSWEDMLNKKTAEGHH